MGINIQMTEKEYLQQENKKNPPGMIPRNWKILRLGDMCYNKGDYGLNAPAIDYSNNVPTYLRITDIDDNGKFRTEDIKSVDNPMAKDYYLKDGDIVFARTGATVGKTYLYNPKDGQLVYAGFLIKFSPNRDIILPYYLKIYTETNMYKNWVAVVSQRSGQPGINASEYCSFKMLVPPIDEQKKIVAILSEWDKAIELQTKLIERLELRKRALMQRLLTGCVRLQGFSGKWKKIKLGNCCERVIRRNSSINKNVMTISAQKGFVTQTDFFNKTIASEVLDNYYLVHKDEFCYNKSYSNGYPMGAIKRLKEANEAVVTTLYICFRLKENADINIEFFEQYCEFGGLNRELVKVANEGGRAHGLLNVAPTDFFNIKFAVPSVLEQEAIANRLIAADKEIEFEKQKLSLLRTQKQGLMQQLLTDTKRAKTNI